MEYIVNIVVSKEISEKEKEEKTKQFQAAFVIAAVNYFKTKEVKKIS